MAIRIVPSGAPVGAEVQGVDLAAPGEAAIKTIGEAIGLYSVLAFRQQALTPQQLIDFTKHFGSLYRMRNDPAYSPAGYPDITRISNIFEGGRPIGSLEAGQYWHSDHSVIKAPPLRGCLYALEIPHDDTGAPLGDTLFSGAAEAYETLPDDIRERIAGRFATHDHTKRAMSAKRSEYGTKRDGARIDQPIVRTHPITQRKCLYVNEGYTTRIVGMEKEESDALLSFMFRHIKREEMLYRHRWAVGDVVLWDDCALQHCAVADYPLERHRLLYRTAVAGPEVH